MEKASWHIRHGYRVGVRHALCADGTRRYARLTGGPDTFFSIPAQVQVRAGGKRVTVTGFVTLDSCSEDIEFTANSYGRNGHLLPSIRPAGVE